MSDLDTTDGNNWTVAVFKCPRKNWTETLSKIFSELDKNEQVLIPHYTLRSFEKSTDSFTISLRILRKQESEENIKSHIKKCLKDYSYEIDPKAESYFFNFHQWIAHGSKSEKWTREQCKVLNKLSRFALKIINSDTTLEDRLSWTHLFSNMIAIFDYEKSVYSLETYPNILPLKYHHS